MKKMLLLLVTALVLTFAAVPAFADTVTNPEPPIGNWPNPWDWDIN